MKIFDEMVQPPTAAKGMSPRRARFRITELMPESGTVNLQRWGMVGAKTTSFAKLFVNDDEEAVYMDLIPREVVFDGWARGVYTEERPLRGCIIGGLRTAEPYQSLGYATFFLNLVLDKLKASGEVDIIINFVLDERLSFFLERGWEAVGEDVAVKVEQPGLGLVPLPDKFTCLIHRLGNEGRIDMPEETVECKGLPA